jgi:hypothetical protein
MIGHRCKDCSWFDREHESIKEIAKLISGKYEVGYCRKHRPVVFQMDAHYWGGWALVDINDLCGEFRVNDRS